MIRSCVRITGLWLLVLTAASLPAQRRGGGGGNLPGPTTANLVLHGLVVLPDGIVPERLVRVERLCGGRAEAFTYADSKGRFSFDLGVVDVAPGGAAPGVSTAIGAKGMANCSIRASLSGYRPRSVLLEEAAKNEKATLGNMLLQPIGKRQSALISVTDASAPKNAQKDYEKGLDSVAKSKFPDATAAMEKATSDYPKYATAWLSLGLLQTAQNDIAASLRSFAQAIAADDMFVPPYVESAALESASEDWAKTLEHTNKAISLDPDSFAEAYYLNAMANFRLKQTEAARKSAAEGIRIDQDHQYPDLQYIDGILLMGNNDREGARKDFQLYLDIAPNGINAGNARQLLTELSPQK